jgi:hypothetical protein
MPRELQVEKSKSTGKSPGRRIDATRTTTPPASAAARPCIIARPPRRTAPARHVWLEVRAPSSHRAAASIVTLPVRAPRTLDAITAAA